MRLSLPHVLTDQCRKLLLPILTEISRQKNIDSNIRLDAVTTIAMRTTYNLNDVKLLEQSLKDSNLVIRVNAAYSLKRLGKIDSKSAVTIFVEGLKSDNPLAKLHATFALHKMCLRIRIRSEEDKASCSEAKLAIPFLIDILKVNIKPLQYATA